MAEFVGLAGLLLGVLFSGLMVARHFLDRRDQRWLQAKMAALEAGQ